MPTCPECGEHSPERARFCLACAAPLWPADMAGGRRTVTILFADITGSTGLGESLDAESLRRVMNRYFEEMRRIIERHGGTVEKFIGDEVMAVFGVPTVHEDDALRAVRASAEMRARLSSLNDELESSWGVRLAARTGLNTGEVVVGDPAGGGTFVTGEAVVLAKRLQQVAEPAQILIGEATFPLVRDAVEAELLEGLALKGKRDAAAAWLLGSVDASAPGLARRLDAPLVGRGDELEGLVAAFDAAIGSRECRIATVLGPAGIGKSRLAAELASAIGERGRVLTGRCLPYGEGITFWPLAEIVREAGDELAATLASEPDGAPVLERIRGALRSHGPPVVAAETFWAARRLLETLARARPLLLVLDDLHWAEPTFLDLLDYVAGWTRDAPLLVLCLARPELLEKRPDWARPSSGSLLLTLEPLSDAESSRLLGAFRGGLLGDRTRDRIVAAAEGNPLFLEQMLAMALEEPDAPVRIPPSIHALLAERLDRLTPEQRLVIERASVIGKEFTREAVTHLCPPELQPAVETQLLALVRKELLVPSATPQAEGDGFEFRHLLIRDTAYAGLAKEVRALLHVRFAEWIGHTMGERTGELDEIVGYHLEQAHGYRLELGPDDGETRRIGEAGSALLARAGRRALAGDDVPAATSLLERALALGAADAAERPLWLVELGSALMKQGAFGRAERALEQATATAVRAGDRGAQVRALLEREFLRSFTAPATREHERLAESLIPELTAAGDHLGLAKAWLLVSDSHVSACRWHERAVALERALDHARQAADAPQQASAIVAALAQALQYGPTPVPQAIARCREFLGDVRNDRALRAALNTTLAALLAAQGAFDEARALYSESVSLYEELGLRLRRAARTLAGAEIELLAGDLQAAERELRTGYATLESMGEQSARPVVAAYLADVLCAEGRDAEAARFARTAAELAEADDVATQVLRGTVEARLLARRGRLSEAEEVALEAVALAADTDFSALRAATLVALADVLDDAGRADEARALLVDGRSVHDSKGNVVAAGRLTARLGLPVP